jgi:hypothetical protein
VKAKKAGAAKRAGKAKKKNLTMAAALKAVNGMAAVASPLADFQGRLVVPSGEAFTVEATMLHDVPIWKITLAGRTDTGAAFERQIGPNMAHMPATQVAGVPDGDYQLVITVTLQDPAGSFEVRSKSSIDEDRDGFVFVPNNPVQFDFRPVRVG